MIDVLENVVASYHFHTFDAHDNDQYFFKVGNTDSLKNLMTSLETIVMLR